jgi:hypothetical protein
MIAIWSFMLGLLFGYWLAIVIVFLAAYPFYRKLCKENDILRKAKA